MLNGHFGMIRPSSAFTHGHHYEGSRDILALLIGHPVGVLRGSNDNHEKATA